MVSLIILAPGAVVLSGLLYGVGIVVYNLFFHPYSKYPGPFWAKITPFYSVWHAYTGDLHIDVLRCHEKYGESCVGGHPENCKVFTDLFRTGCQVHT